MRTYPLAALTAAGALAAGLALAQTMDHSGHGAAPADASPSTAGYMAANDRMHEGMAIDFTGNADIDFALGMIPHHQGAIDMARVVLEHGQDPQIRALAEEIIAAQEAEIAFLREWLDTQTE
jgi:uncharacterized protein (DUF305 family)